jgi:ribonuclease HI
MPDSEYYQAWIDGACRGNPGEAAIGGILRDSSGDVVFQFSQAIGNATNNIAEYRALEYLLTFMVGYSKSSTSIKGLVVHSDSELLVRQVKGSYKARKKHLKPLHNSVRKLIAQLPFPVQLVSVERCLNQEADRLANQAFGIVTSAANLVSGAPI